MIKKETSKAINSGSLRGSYISHPILQYCLLHDPGHRKSRKRKLQGYHCNETKKVGVLKKYCYYYNNYLTIKNIIPRVHVGYEMVDSQHGSIAPSWL